jgi:hypothetical protein
VASQSGHGGIDDVSVSQILRAAFLRSRHFRHSLSRSFVLPLRRLGRLSRALRAAKHVLIRFSFRAGDWAPTSDGFPAAACGPADSTDPVDSMNGQLVFHCNTKRQAKVISGKMKTYQAAPSGATDWFRGLGRSLTAQFHLAPTFSSSRCRETSGYKCSPDANKDPGGSL